MDTLSLQKKLKWVGIELASNNVCFITNNVNKYTNLLARLNRRSIGYKITVFSTGILLVNWFKARDRNNRGFLETS